MTEKPWNPDPNDPALKARVTKRLDGRLSVVLEDNRAVHELGGVLRISRLGRKGQALIDALKKTDVQLKSQAARDLEEERKALAAGRLVQYQGVKQ